MIRPGELNEKPGGAGFRPRSRMGRGRGASRTQNPSSTPDRRRISHKKVPQPDPLASICVQPAVLASISVPKGRARIAQRFNAGTRIRRQAKSQRDEGIALRSSASIVPDGTRRRGRLFPALKRWAFIFRPAGLVTALAPQSSNHPRAPRPPFPPRHQARGR